MSTPKVVSELLARSNRLGSEPRFTNYAGGNTSAKGVVANPATGKDTTVLWVKGSGGDLGTLKESGLAALDLDKFKDLKNVYPGVEREDEMVALFDYCAFGKGGAAPSIDTSMHGLVDFDHVDHLHPDSIIALATSKDGKKLTAECFGEEILWVDWRRPGFQLGLDMAKIAKENPRITSPPNTSIAPTAISVVSDVISVRLRVSLTERFITSFNGMVLYLIRFSRRRSKTTTVSLIE